MAFDKGKVGFTDRQRVITRIDSAQVEDLKTVDISADQLSELKSVTLEAGPLTDLFFRTAVSNPETLFDSKQIYADAQDVFWSNQELSGSGTKFQFTQDTASTTLSVMASIAGFRVRQSKMRFNYQPGKSQEVIITGVLRKGNLPGDDLTGIKRGWGLGDDSNGIFLVDDNGVVKIVIRSSTSGEGVDTEYPQSGWTDPLDGTGASGVTIDWTKSQIFAFRFEWLGVGGVRILFGIDNKPVLGTEIYHANTQDVVYMSTPNLPIRYFIQNDGTGSAASIDAICCTVISEGGNQDGGQIRAVTTNNTTITLLTTNVWYGLIGIKLKTTDLGAVVKILKTQLVVLSSSDTIEWCLAYNPVLNAGATSFEGIPSNSSIQYHICNGTQSFDDPEFILDFGFAATGGNQAGSTSIAEQLDTALRLGAEADGTRDEIFLLAKGINGSASVQIQCGIVWRELS